MKKLIIPIMLFMVLTLVGMALGATTFATPTASGVMSGSYKINITSTTLNNISNCTVTGTSALTGGSFTVEANASDAEAGLQANVTYDTTLLPDASDWVLTGTCYNLTLGTTDTITSRTATVDNLNPVCTHVTLSSDSEVEMTDYSYTITITGTNGTSGTVNFSGNTYTLSESSDVFTYDIGRIPATSYTVKASVTDGYNTTLCTTLNNVILKNKETSTGYSLVLPDNGELVIGDTPLKGTGWLNSFISWFMSLFGF